MAVDLNTFSLYPLAMADHKQMLATNSVETLLGISHTLEDIVMRHRWNGTFYAGFQRTSAFLPQLERFSRLASICGEVLIFAYPDAPVPAVPGVRIVPLASDAPLVQEWFIVVDYVEFGAALLTRQLSGGDSERVRRNVLEFGRGRLYEGLVTFDPRIVTPARAALEEATGRVPVIVDGAPTYQAVDSVYTEFGRDLVRYLEQNNQQLRGLYHTLEQRTRELERLQQVVRTLVSQRAWEEAQSAEVVTDQRRSTLEVQHLTILFTDIEGFTRLSEAEDPEVLLRSLNRYLDLLATTVYRYHGDIDKFLGDGMLAFFDDALAGIQAGTAILRRLEAFNAQQIAARGPVLATRVGLASGLCLIGRVGSQDRQEITVFGDAVNLASRLQLKAQPGGLVMDGATFAAVQHSPCVLHTMTRIRGKQEMQTVYEVTPGCLENFERDLNRVRMDQRAAD